MRYEGAIYRPPSEAGSLILQATIGCSHNQCTFCISFIDKKYRERDLQDIFEDIDSAAGYFRDVRRVFLADGNAMAMDSPKLLKILAKLYGTFPQLERVSIYATPRDLLHKQPQELAELKKAGMGIVYMGVETGNEELLAWIRKGATREEVSKAGQRAREAGLILSVTVINGLGGNEKMAAHAYDTATLLNEIDPDYLGLLTLMVCQGTPLARQVERGKFEVPAPLEILHEIRMMLEPLELTNCVFRCNHASNYLPLKGTLPQDKKALLQTLDSVYHQGDTRSLRPEYLRGL
ncbi:MAG: radical SAM protein [Dethiobacteria bacterium]|jgi:radical SAM superfamily enzyme YgiQ (UPF0313 family)